MLEKKEENPESKELVDDENEKKLNSNFFLKFIRGNAQNFLTTIKIIENEGFSNLYNGISSAMIGIVFSSGIYFCGYKYFKNVLERNNFSKGIIVDSMITSFLASTVTSCLSNPIWVLNSRMAKAKKLGNMTNYDMIKQIYNEEGIKGFYKGLIPSIFMTANPVIQFIIYEFLRSKLVDVKGDIKAVHVVLISLISKLITTLITYPMLTVKTLFQANEKKSNSEIFDILSNLSKEEGLPGFYKGIIS
jgi:adenine nucleotide transporter 17